MGIDIYLEWEGKNKQAKDDQMSIGFSPTSGHVGYLREAYHGGPYATQILVKEAFESDDCRAEIPAAVMRERLTNAAPAAEGCNGGHAMTALMSKLLGGVMAGEDISKDPNQFLAKLQAEINENSAALEIPDSLTPAMSVEAAARERCLRLYPEAGSEHAEDVVQSFRDFVALAERRERETGKPCTVYASY